MNGPLDGIRILDFTRVLAGPTCTQLLGDLGADIIKVERPRIGDDTRKWGPPYLKDSNSRNTSESAYYLSANRNKRSITLDLEKPEGQKLAKRLIASCDVVVENFKVGGMTKYKLAWPQLKECFPRLVYCSVTGFGQTGPYASRPGYDFLVQGMGGMMSLTGEPSGEPIKVGIGIADIVAGMHATTGILAALRHRDRSGEGQHIDMALLDSQISWLSYEGMNYLVSGKPPERRGNAHPNIVPYQVFPTANGHIILGVGNDRQFSRFCDFAGAPELSHDDRFRTNEARVRNRETLIPLLTKIIGFHPSRYWLEGLEALGVPCGPINTVPEALTDPQVQARGMEIVMDHTYARDVRFIGCPVKMSATPATYRRAPPLLGEHTKDVLSELLGLGPAMIADLYDRGVI